MAKPHVVWRCQQCGTTAPRWLGRCSGCGEFGTLVEEKVQTDKAVRGNGAASSVNPVSLADIDVAGHDRIASGLTELDRVLGGGLVQGSLILLAGEPGIGKSTLLLQAADALAQDGRKVLYVCGEESPEQIGMRARRLGLTCPSISLLPEIDIGSIDAVVSRDAPDVLVVDSIQTMHDPELTGVPGSVGQVRSCAAQFMRIAKNRGVTTFLVGHVTKDGSVAGPRVLEHTVDTVLSFEGDADHAFRIVRATKNRFGPTSEVGIFEMGERGLEAVGHPSEALLAGRSRPVPGSVVMAAMEGSRPLMLEIQALVNPSTLPSPRRLATGIETPRLLQVIAVLERRASVSLAGFDIYVSVAGGLRVTEPAVDLPLALAIASARKDVPISHDTAAFGELALTGLVRPVPHAERRRAEADRLGIKNVLGPQGRVSERAADPTWPMVSDIAGAIAHL